MILKPKNKPGPWMQMPNPKTDMFVHEYDMETTATVVQEKSPTVWIIQYKGKTFWSEKAEWIEEVAGE